MNAPAKAISSKTVTLIFGLTLTDDLDFGTKERVLPQGNYIYVKHESSITYHSKDMASVKVFADEQTDQRRNGRTGQKLSIDAGA